MKETLIVVLVTALGGLGMALHGYVLSIIWAWFVVPTFGIARLSVPAAIGISILIKTITTESGSDKDENKSSAAVIWSALVSVFGAPLFALFVCWILTHWM